MHEVLVNRLGGLRLPRKSVVRLTDRPDMTLDVYRGRKTTIQRRSKKNLFFILVSNYRQLHEFTVVVFFVSANIITVGQCSSLTIKELESSDHTCLVSIK